MFTLRIKEMLLLRGYKPTSYSLEKLGIPHTAAVQYYYNKAKSIKLEHLYKLCIALDCTPMDLMQVEKPADYQWEEQMPLYAWRARPVVNPFDKMKTLSPEKIQQLNAFLAEND